MNNTTILETAINTYGVNLQKITAMEEMAELTKELSKSMRYGDKNVENITEEIADVEIMLEQLKMIYQNSADVEAEKQRKIKRLAERLKKGGM